MRLMKPMWQSTRPDRPRQHRLSRSSEDHLTATALTSINDDLQRAKTKVEALSRDALKLMAPLLRQRQNLVAIKQSGDTEVTSLGHFDFHNLASDWNLIRSALVPFCYLIRSALVPFCSGKLLSGLPSPCVWSQTCHSAVFAQAFIKCHSHADPGVL